MARKSSKQKNGGKKAAWLSSWEPAQKRTLLYRSSLLLVAAVTIVVVAVGMRRLEAHVDGKLADRFDPVLAIVDVPPSVSGLADASLRRALEPLLLKDWTDDGLCRELAEQASLVAWVKDVEYVRRTASGVFEVRCAYRVPVAMVQQGKDLMLVDGQGVRLPGRYRYDPEWMVIRGVAAPSPLAGEAWRGADVLAGLAMVGALRGEPYSRQITAVRVDNYEGRNDPRASHIVLQTDRPVGFILWGSSPGRELEENSTQQKLAILRENYARTGRVDAGRQAIDISIYPDRFIEISLPSPDSLRGIK